ncbi:MAG: AAA family ATPase [Planctomycetaceae bacterium]|nr:AAA family ATPase [Planctomycetaceae bacterium]
MTRLVGREAEKAELRKSLDSTEAELIAVYGRRRVGKTFLVREYFGERLCFELTGVHDASLTEQLQNFSFALGQAMRSPVPLETPANWQQAFQQLITYVESLPKTGKHVVFLDELPWLASRRSRFMPAFEHFWNAWASRQSHLIVVVCGSAASWMINKVIRQRGGLHNRLTRRIRLEPFSLAEASEYLGSRRVHLTPYQTAELYMAMGGIPHYLKEVVPGQSAAQNIDQICFAKTGLLQSEFHQLYASLFEDSDRHMRVIRSLARKRRGMTRNEMLSSAGIPTGGGATMLIDELVESGFVKRVYPFERGKKNALYHLADEYSLFYLSWIEGNRSSGSDIWMKKQRTPAWRAWSGYAFESLCLKHMPQIKRTLGIEGVETEESSWCHRAKGENEKGAQIDLLIDRRDHCINLCEMKFSEGEFVIDKRYAGELRNKRDVFQRTTGTRKTIFLTMVTAFGVKENAYSRDLVANTIEIESLFT